MADLLLLSQIQVNNIPEGGYNSDSSSCVSVSNNHVSGSNHVSHGSSNHVAARDPDDTSRADSSRLSTCSRQNSGITCYRFGSVGQDTLICLWDLTEDVLKQARVHSGEKITFSK